MSEKTYYPTIGLEVHAELKTNTKMFCRCKNDPDEEKPNSNVCPVCMGHPGTLPTINKEAVKHVLRMGVAVGGTIADFTEFDRKNYFYPDIPKGYQISQYKYPLISGGELSGVALTRIHLEEDTATSKHDEGDYSLVDFNRSSVPLMELVTEPVIHDAETAGKFAKELQLLLRYLWAGDANMEKGEMRVEANISISEDPKVFGTKVEVKNLNSFKAVEKAIAYEIERHRLLLENGEKISQETRGWDENTGKTFSQRKKEDSHDYRYFPDPDLPKLKLREVEEFLPEQIKATLPELPREKRQRYMKDFSIKQDDVELLVLNPHLASFFEKAVVKKTDAQLIVNYLLSDVVAIQKTKGDVSFGLLLPEHIRDIAEMIGENILSSRGAKDLIALLYSGGGVAKAVAEAKGLIQKNDPEALKAVLAEIINLNPKVVEEYKAGKVASIQFLVGQGMKATKGSANPKMLQDILITLLS